MGCPAECAGALGKAKEAFGKDLMRISCHARLHARIYSCARVYARVYARVHAGVQHAKEFMREFMQEFMQEFSIHLARPQGAADLIASRIPPGRVELGCWVAVKL